MSAHATASDWIEVGTIDSHSPRGCARVQHAAPQIAVFRTARDEVFAIENRCPHKHGPLSEGIVHGRQVTCPLHNWVFSLATGEARRRRGPRPKLSDQARQWPGLSRQRVSRRP